MLVFGLSVAFSVNVTMFSTLRFFEGFCLAGLALSLYVLSKYTPLTPTLSAFLPRRRRSPFRPLRSLMRDVPWDGKEERNKIFV